MCGIYLQTKEKTNIVCFILLISILLPWILISIMSLILWSVLSFPMLFPDPTTYLKNPISSIRYLRSKITAGLWLSWVQDPVVASQVVEGENITAAYPLIVRSFTHANNTPDSKVSWGQHGAHLGPTGPSWAPCWPHELCYLGPFLIS